MGFDWTEYLNLAKEMHHCAPNSKCSESRHRCAASRAYYAAFCKNRNYLRDVEKDPYLQGNVKHGAEVHSYVIDTCKRGPQPTKKRIGTDLDRMRNRRNQADYDDFVVDPVALAQATMSYAENVLRWLSILETNPPTSSGYF